MRFHFFQESSLTVLHVDDALGTIIRAVCGGEGWAATVLFAHEIPGCLRNALHLRYLSRIRALVSTQYFDVRNFLGIYGEFSADPFVEPLFVDPIPFFLSRQNQFFEIRNEVRTTRRLLVFPRELRIRISKLTCGLGFMLAQTVSYVSCNSFCLTSSSDLLTLYSLICCSNNCVRNRE